MCKEKGGLFAFGLDRLERRRGDARFELSLAPLLQQIAHQPRKRRRIVDAADPHAIGTELLAPPNLMRQRGKRDDHGPRKALRPAEDAKYVRGVRFPDRHVNQGRLGLELSAQLLDILVGKCGPRPVTGIGKQLLIGDRLARIVLEDEDDIRA